MASRRSGKQTRFTDKTPPTVRVSSQVKSGTVIPIRTTTSRTTRATRFTPTREQTPRPTITRMTQRTTRPTSTFVDRSVQAQRKDDFQRSLDPLPRAFAETERTQPVSSIVDRQSFRDRPRPSRTGIRESVITPPLPLAENIVSVPSGRQVSLLQVREKDPRTKGDRGFINRQGEFQLSDSQRADLKSQPSQSREQQLENVQALLDQGVITVAEAERRERQAGGRTEFEQQFASFGGGVRQEFENIGSLADDRLTRRREVGSLVIDLPFAVAGETFTRPSVEKTGGTFGSGGVLGLGFDFRSADNLFEEGFDAGAKLSGETQEEIGRKFSEDPARALGSIAAVATVEAGLFLATGGVGNLAVRGFTKVGSQLAKNKAVQTAIKLNREIDKVYDEEDVIRSGAVPLGSGGNYANFRGTEALGKLVTKDEQGILQSIRVIEQPVGAKPVKVAIQAVDSKGIQVTRNIEVKFPKIAQGKIKKGDILEPKENVKTLDIIREGKQLEGAGGRVKIDVGIAKESEVPITIIQTGKQVRTIPEFATDKARQAFFKNEQLVELGKKIGAKTDGTAGFGDEAFVPKGVSFVKQSIAGKTIAFGKNIPSDIERTVFQNPKTLDVFLLNTDTTKASLLRNQLFTGLKPTKNIRETKGLQNTLIEGVNLQEPSFISIREGLGKTVNPIGIDAVSFTTKSLKSDDAVKTFVSLIETGGKTKAREALTKAETKLLLQEGKLGTLENLGIKSFTEGGILGGGKPLLATPNVKRTFIGEVAFFEKGKLPKGVSRDDLDNIFAREVQKTKPDTTDIFGRPLKESGVFGQADITIRDLGTRGAGLQQIKSTKVGIKNIKQADKTVDDINKIFSEEGSAQTTVQITKTTPKQIPTNVGKIADVFTVEEVVVRQIPKRTGLFGTALGLGSQQRQGFGDDIASITNVKTLQVLDTGLDTGQGGGQISDIFGITDRIIPERTGGGQITDIFTRTTPRVDTPPRTTVIPRLDQPLIQDIVEDPIVPTTTKEIFGGAPPPPSNLPLFPDPFGSRKRRRGRKKDSRLGGRLFDIADEPFGEVSVGLGFFVETERGEDTIEDALGIQPDFEPITRQEKQARARLGVGKKSRRSQNFAEGFDFGEFFN